MYHLSKLLSVSFLALIFLTANPVFAQKNVELKLKTSVDCSTDSLRIFAWEGIMVKPVASVAASSDKKSKTFQFNLMKLEAGTYYIGVSMKAMRPILLGYESKVLMNAENCMDANSYTFEQSKVNQSLLRALDSIKVFSTEFFTVISQYQSNLQNPEVLKTLDVQLANIDAKRKKLLKTMKKEAPDVAKIIALYTYLSYQNNRKDANQREGDYLATNFFQFASLSDDCYYRHPFFYEAIKSYATNLTKVGLTEQEIDAYFRDLLSNVSRDNPHYQSALLGLAFGVYSSKNHKQTFLKYAGEYLKIYEGDNLELDKFMKQQIVVIRGAVPIGEEAPDFSAATPDGKELALKDLRGKVLLVDFWASWCGPCRRENPHVVNMYKKYKSKGFDVLGVSLDQKKDRWLAAIEKDGLKWNHISDLKGWSSAPAKLYQVRSIPFTILLDKDGKVIAKNLRGHALEAKLKEIFGE